MLTTLTEVSTIRLLYFKFLQEMPLKILMYPDVQVEIESLTVPFAESVKKIWNGYRTCYSKSFDYFNDNTPKDTEKLISEIVDDNIKACKLLKTVKDRFAYPEDPFDDLENEFLDLDESEQRRHLKFCVENLSKDPMYLLMANACRWIAPKLKQGHESPFEHGTITFTVKDCSRSLTHQLVRHRIASYSQASQRYISENPEDLTFVIPPNIQNNPDAFGTVKNYLGQLEGVIKDLKTLGIKNEDIRCIYPNAISTDIQVTMNFRELKHFIELRLSRHAQDEIRYVAWVLLTYMCNHMPFIWSDIKLDF